MMEHEMKVVCAWCQGHMRGPEDASRVSHGICPPCREREETTFRRLTGTKVNKVITGPIEKPLVPDAEQNWHNAQADFEQWVDLGGES